MRKTFEDLIKENQTESHRLSSYIDVIRSEKVLDLLQQIREATIKECIELSKIKYYAGETGYLDKDVILQLDKNSIEIYEI